MKRSCYAQWACLRRKPCQTSDRSAWIPSSHCAGTGASASLNDFSLCKCTIRTGPDLCTGPWRRAIASNSLTQSLPAHPNSLKEARSARSNAATHTRTTVPRKSRSSPAPLASRTSRIFADLDNLVLSLFQVNLRHDVCAIFRVCWSAHTCDFRTRL